MTDYLGKLEYRTLLLEGEEDFNKRYELPGDAKEGWSSWAPLLGNGTISLAYARTDFEIRVAKGYQITELPKPEVPVGAYLDHTGYLYIKTKRGWSYIDYADSRIILTRDMDELWREQHNV